MSQSLEESYKKLLLVTNCAVALLWFACVNASTIFVYDQFPSVDTIYGKGWIIALCYVLVTVFALSVLSTQENALQKLEDVLMRSKWVAAFVLLATLSVIWSVNARATLYEAILLVCSTILSIFLYLQFPLRAFISVISLIAAICVTISWLLVILLPETAIMWGQYHFASWMGLFWHRNHAGIMMAFFNMVFLFQLLFHTSRSKMSKRDKATWFYIAFYILSAIHVFGSQSATGKVIFAALNIFIIGAYLWHSGSFFTRKSHTYGLCLLFVVALGIFLVNPDFFFSLLNRDSSMTGRTGMWPDLITNTFLDRPILGHGFATAWTESQFRSLIMQRWGWSYQPYFADNGFIDLMIGLGGIGLAIVLYGMATTIFRILRRLYVDRTSDDIFLLGLLGFVFLSNIAYSFLFEIEYLTWSFLIITFLFSSGRHYQPVSEQMEHSHTLKY